MVIVRKVLEPLFMLEEPEKEEGKSGHNEDDNPEVVRMSYERQVGCVHSENGGDEHEWKRNKCHNGEHLHYFVLFGG